MTPVIVERMQSDYSVRHGVYVRCLTNQSAAIVYVTGCTYAVQPITARLWRTSQGVRHGVYVRGSTNQSAAMAYVTGCTYAFQPIRARCSRILISAAPCGGLRPPSPPPPPKKKGGWSAFIILLRSFKWERIWKYLQICLGLQRSVVVKS